MIEEQYRELAEHAREKYIEYEKRNHDLLIEIHELKKEILTTFGIIRLIDNELEEIDELELHPSKKMLENLRSHLSELFDKLINPQITQIFIERNED